MLARSYLFGRTFTAAGGLSSNFWPSPLANFPAAGLGYYLLSRVIKFPFYRPKYRLAVEANSGNRAAGRFPPSNFVCLESDRW